MSAWVLCGGELRGPLPKSLIISPPTRHADLSDVISPGLHLLMKQTNLQYESRTATESIVGLYLQNFGVLSMIEAVTYLSLEASRVSFREKA